MTGAVIRVLLIEDHPIVREGVRLILGQTTDIVVVGGIWKYTAASARSRVLIEHDLACARLALRERCFDHDTAWTIRRQIRLTPPPWKAEQVLTPDFAVPLVTPADPQFGREEECFTCYVEVEGTNELQHIVAKHHRYAALARTLRAERDERPHARAYATEIILVLVLNFTPEQQQQRRTMLRRHAVAYANRRDGHNYRVEVIDLADLLAAQADHPAWQLATLIDYDDERARLQRYWNHRPGNEPTGDFER